MPGDAPSLVLMWAVEALAKNGTLAVIGVYSDASKTFPVGAAMEKNLTVKLGNCDHRKFIPPLLEAVRTGAIDPLQVLSQVEPMGSAIEAYEAFDLRAAGWIKVELEPRALH